MKPARKTEKLATKVPKPVAEAFEELAWMLRSDVSSLLRQQVYATLKAAGKLPVVTTDE